MSTHRAAVRRRGARRQRVRDWAPALRRPRARHRRLAVARSPLLDVQRFLLPPPPTSLQALWDERTRCWRGRAGITFKEALGGFVHRLRRRRSSSRSSSRAAAPFGDALMPYAIAANAVPIIAFAPITNAWFGTLSPWSKMAIAAVLCFFPVLVNTLRGLTSVRPESIELMRSYAAGERRRSSGACGSRTRCRSSSRP